MPFEKYKTHKGYFKTTYTDDTIDEIFKNKSDLIGNLTREIEFLNNLKNDLEKDYKKAEEKYQSISDWDLPEYEDAYDAAMDIRDQIWALDDLIEQFEDLLNNLY